MKKILGLLLLVPSVSLGTIEPIVIHLSNTNFVSGTRHYSGDSSYTVPSGKVLIIEAVSGMQEIYIISGGFTNSVSLYDIMSNQRSVKVPSGTILAAQEAWSSLVLFCLLAESSDLYASISAQTDNLTAQNGIFSFDVQTASPRPARISVDGSTDLALAWQPADATVKKKAPDTFSVSIPVGDEDQYFAKYKVRDLNP